MRFEYFTPCDALKPFISYFAIQEAREENTYRVLPGISVVVGFQFKGRLSLVDDTREATLSTTGITGLTDRHKRFRNSKDIGTVLVFFKETGAANFFRQPLHEVFGESVSLENFLVRSELLIVEEQLYEATTDSQRIAVVERFLISQMKARQPDRLVMSALAFIHGARGNIRISELARALNTSQSPLEKRFRQSVGTTAKKFASIVRMKHLLNSLHGQQSLSDLAYEAGFYDQAHFIKEFKSFTGETPTSFLSDAKE